MNHKGAILHPSSSQPEMLRFDKVVAFRTGEGRVLGFHSHNLQVAELDPLIWEALLSNTGQGSQNFVAQAQQELLEWNNEVDSQVTDANVSQKVRSLTINVSQICNLKCTYCAAGGDGTYGSKTARIDVSRATAQLDWLLHDVPNGGRFNINFLGGEPLIYPEAVEQIARHAKLATAGRQITLNFEMTTNGTLVSAKAAEMLAKINCNVTVSMDGAAGTNDRVRPTAGGGPSSARTLKGIAELFKVKERLGSLNVHSVFGAHNLAVLEAYDYLKTFPWDSIVFTYAVGAEDEVYSPLYSEALAQVIQKAYDEGGETALRRLSQLDHFFRIFDGQQRIHNHCGAGKTLLQVDTEGRFSVCNWFVNDPQEEVGRNLEINQEALQKYSKSLIELNNCGSCWAKFVCGGGCMFVNRARSGNKHQLDPEFCSRMRSLVTKGIEFYEKCRHPSSALAHNEGV
jgi:uncharacterized protein